MNQPNTQPKHHLLIAIIVVVAILVMVVMWQGAKSIKTPNSTAEVDDFQQAQQSELTYQSPYQVTDMPFESPRLKGTIPVFANLQFTDNGDFFTLSDEEATFFASFESSFSPADHAPNALQETFSLTNAYGNEFLVSKVDNPDAEYMNYLVEFLNTEKQILFPINTLKDAESYQKVLTLLHHLMIDLK